MINFQLLVSPIRVLFYCRSRLIMSAHKEGGKYAIVQHGAVGKLFDDSKIEAESVDEAASLMKEFAYNICDDLGQMCDITTGFLAI